MLYSTKPFEYFKRVYAAKLANTVASRKSVFPADISSSHSSIIAGDCGGI